MAKPVVINEALMLWLGLVMGRSPGHIPWDVGYPLVQYGSALNTKLAVTAPDAAMVTTWL